MIKNNSFENKLRNINVCFGFFSVIMFMKTNQRDNINYYACLGKQRQKIILQLQIEWLF